MSCPTLETVAAWAVDELAPADRDDLEEHLFACEACFRRAGGMMALVRHLGAMVPIFLTMDRRRRLEAGPSPVTVVPVPAGGRGTLVFPGGPDVGLWVMQADLRGVERVDCEMFAPDGTRLTEVPDVPFDAERGELVLGCQRHFRDLPFPTELRVRLSAVEGGSRRPLGEYVLDHVYDPV